MEKKTWKRVKKVDVIILNHVTLEGSRRKDKPLKHRKGTWTSPFTKKMIYRREKKNSKLLIKSGGST